MYTEQEAYRRLAEELIGSIQHGKLQQESIIPTEAALAKEMKMNRLAVRRAVQHFQMMGILEQDAEKNYRLTGNVTDRLQETLHIILLLKHILPEEVCQVRRMMDQEALRLAFARRDQLDLDALKHLLERIWYGNVLDSIEADEASHIWLMEASGNQLMKNIMQSVWAICSTQMNLLLADGTEELHQKQKLVHEQLYKSLLRGDLEMGLEAVQVHYDTIEACLNACIEQQLFQSQPDVAASTEFTERSVATG